MRQGDKGRLHVMLQLFSISLLLICSVLTAAVRESSAAGQPYLVKDILPLTWSGSPSAAVAFNGNLYFAATDGLHGVELWRSSGTPGDAQMVKDLNPGPSGSNPELLTVYNNKLYFAADDGANGKELWVTDGLSDPVLLEIRPGSSGATISDLTIAGGKLFFAANDGINGKELWDIDGAAAPAMVKNIRTAGSSNPSLLTDVNGMLFFSANDGIHGEALWMSDGTSGNTAIVLDKNLQPVLSPASLCNLNGLLLFQGRDASGLYGYELWKSNGSPAGTDLVLDIRAGTASSYPVVITKLGNSVYFQADDGIHGNELWVSDGTAAGTGLLADLRPGTYLSGSGPSDFTEVDGKLFFTADDGVSGRELYYYDPAQPVSGANPLLLDINPGPASSYPGSLTRVNNVLFFSAETAAAGSELWRSDGTLVGTVPVKDIYPGPDSAGPEMFSSVNNTLYFAADDGIKGKELWMSDGTETGTVLLSDLNKTGGSAITGISRVGDRIYFQAEDGLSGPELWTSNGTTGGTSLVLDIYAGPLGSAPAEFARLKNLLLFSAADVGGGTELWRSDGTAAGTQLVKDINPGSAGSSPQHLTTVGPGVFFDAFDGASTELWRSDGTAAGTVLVKKINPVGDSIPSPAELLNLNGTLFFTADDGTHDIELWKSDGTAAGTVLVKDIAAGGASWPAGLTKVGSKLFFSADDWVNGNELWMSDGTAAGTQLVSDINPGSWSSNPAYLTEVNNILYFAADDGVHGVELWRSNGTPGGTALVKDISSGSADSFPENLTRVNGTLYFTADDGVHGIELWKSDGTSGGTMLVKDINTAGDSSPSGLLNGNGILYFTADDGVSGRELWQSDGTPEGTRMVIDLMPGIIGSNPTELTRVYGRLYFSAADPLSGTELWAYDLPTSDVSAPQTVFSLQPGTFTTPQIVSLTCTDTGGSGCDDIFYTLDGSAPTLLNAYRYEGAITLASTTKLSFFSIDGAGNAESPQILDYTINPVLPVVTITAPRNGSTQKLVNVITGTASAGAPAWGLNRVEISVTDGTNYLRADHGWSPTEQWLTASGTTTWSYDTSYGGGPWTNDTWYTITARAFDNYGNFETTSVHFYYYTGAKVFTYLTLTLSSQAILSNGTLSASGRLIRFPDVGVDLSGLPIFFTITRPDHTTVLPLPSTTTYDAAGHYILTGNIPAFAQEGVYTIKAHFGGDTYLLASDSVEKQVVVGAAAGYAIIVEGRIPGGEGQETHNKTANKIYERLLDRNFTAENIYYMNYQTSGQPSHIQVDTSPSKTGVRDAIEIWARDKMSTQPAPLYIILVDHGNPDTFYLDTSTISPTELNTWLGNLETSLLSLNAAALNKKRVVIVGTCYSGSFIDELSKEGRVLITSAAANEESYRGLPEPPDGVRSGEFFLDHLFTFLARGYSVKKAFVFATAETEAYTDKGGGTINSPVYRDSAAQHPLLDDNADKTGSNVLSDSSGDGLIADTLYLGIGVTNAAPNPAEFFNVTPTVFLDWNKLGPATPFWGSASDNDAVTSAWIEVRSLVTPLLSGVASSGQRDLTTDRVLMVKQNSRWEADYSQFILPGIYDIYYFTERLVAAGRTEVSVMKRSRVFKRKAFGQNNPPADFNLISPANASDQKTVLMLDWQDSSDSNTFSYIVELAEDETFSVVDYRKEEIPSSITVIGSDANLQDLTKYFWRVYAVDQYGEVKQSSQTWWFRTNNTNSLPGFITGAVTSASTGSGLADTSLIVSQSGTPVGTTVSLSPGGDYYVSVPPGAQDITVSLAGYVTQAASGVYVAPGEEAIKNFALVPQAPAYYTLTVTKNAASTGTGTVSGTGSYPGGSDATATATPGSDAAFTSWSGHCSGTSQTASVTMSSDRNCSALFTLKSYALTVSSGGTGSGTTGGSGTYSHGTSVNATASAHISSTFTGWSGDCSGSSSPALVYMDRVKSCTAGFTLKTFTLTVSKSGTGSGTVTGTGISCGSDCTEVYNYNQVVTLTAAPSAGSSFTGWSGGVCSGTGTCQVTMTQARSVVATFTLNSYTLTLQTAGDGTGRVTGAGTYAVNTTVPVTAIPDANSLFSSWSGNCSGGASTSVLMNADKACTAAFALNPAVTEPVKRMPQDIAYPGLSEALEAVAADNEIIMHMSGRYAAASGSITYAKAYPVTLRGGFNTDFTTNSGAYTTLTISNGGLTLQGGAITVENIVLQ